MSVFVSHEPWIIRQTSDWKVKVKVKVTATLHVLTQIRRIWTGGMPSKSKSYDIPSMHILHITPMHNRLGYEGKSFLLLFINLSLSHLSVENECGLKTEDGGRGPKSKSRFLQILAPTSPSRLLFWIVFSARKNIHNRSRTEDIIIKTYSAPRPPTTNSKLQAQRQEQQKSEYGDFLLLHQCFARKTRGHMEGPWTDADLVFYEENDWKLEWGNKKWVWELVV
jgi:hypothetical protein